MSKSEESPFLGSNGDEEFENEFVATKEFVTVPNKRKCITIAVIFLVIVLVVAGIFSAGILVGHYAVPPLKEEHSVKQEICANPPFVVISLDGFWAGYWKRNITTFLQSVAANGVHAEYMRSGFPTKTFPNHFTIVTGLYPESHGIVNNKFYDTELREVFNLFDGADANDPKWWLGEPVWVTAAKSGLKTGIYFWPGSEVKIQGIRPNYYFRYSDDTPFEERVDTVLSWFDLPEPFRPQFMALYFNEPDHSGHGYGPDSEEVDGALGRVDEVVESFFIGLERREILDCVNIMIVSDHGMTTYNSSRQAKVKQIIPSDVVSDVHVNFYGSVSDMNIYTDNSTIDRVYDAFVEYVNSTAAVFRPYIREDLPLRLHSGHFNKQRYGIIYLIADIGGYLAANTGSALLGQHGYDNNNEHMQAFFLAQGPAFKKGYFAEPFDNIQLYNLMCALLGITPAKNNGTVGALYNMIEPKVAAKLPPVETSSGEPGVLETCPFPDDPATYEERAFCADCICSSCQNVDNSTIDSANKALDISPNQATEYQQDHLPWGVPEGGEGDGSCLLSQQNFIALHSNQLHIPLWVAYKLTREQAQQDASTATCLRRDIRLEPAHSAKCSSYVPASAADFVPVQLVSGLSAKDVQELSTSLLTNVAPQCSDFHDLIWTPLVELERRWAIAFGAVNVITGVVLDADHSGERDADSSYPCWLSGRGSVAIPSHYFKIVLRCLDNKEPGDCDPDRLDTLGLLFQHPPSPGSIRSSVEMTEYALSPVRDIERVTGVNFYPKLTAREQNTIELRITTKLWDN